MDDMKVYLQTWADELYSTPTAKYLSTINIHLGRRMRFLSNATGSHTFVIYCFFNDERVITRWLRLYFNAKLISRICHTAPFMELKFELTG